MIGATEHLEPLLSLRVIVETDCRDGTGNYRVHGLPTPPDAIGRWLDTRSAGTRPGGTNGQFNGQPDRPVGGREHNEPTKLQRPSSRADQLSRRPGMLSGCTSVTSGVAAGWNAGSVPTIGI